MELSVGRTVRKNLQGSVLRLLPYVMVAVLFWVSGCNTVRFIPEGKFLLKKDPVVKGAKSVDTYYAIRTKANRRMLMGPKTFLYLYNIGKTIETDSSWLKARLMERENVRDYYYPFILKVLMKDIGEPPVLLDFESIRKDTINLRNLYFANGFFNPNIRVTIKDTTYRQNNPFYIPKAKIIYNINEGPPSVLDSLHFQIQDKTIASLYQDTIFASSLLKKGENYNHDKMSAERERIAGILRNKGYFNFSPGMITFLVDTTIECSSFGLSKSGLRNAKSDTIHCISITTVIKDTLIQYRIREVRDSLISSEATREDLFANFRTDSLSPTLREFLEIPAKVVRDTGIHLRFRVSRDLLRDINFDFIGRKIQLKEGELYSREKAIKTQRGLQSLTMFQYVTMTYAPNDSLKTIDVKITNKLSPRYQLKAGAESFTNVVNDNSTINSSFNISLGVNGSLRNRNTFSHSEQSEVSGAFLIGLYQANQDTDSARLRLLYEIRSKASIDYPRLITPFQKLNRKDFTMFNPKTTLSGSFRYESRREYQRITVGANYAYQWNYYAYSNRASSTLTPIALDVISVPSALMSEDFRKQIDSLPLLKRDFLPRFSSRIIYTFVHTDYMEKSNTPTHFLRLSLESGGMIPYFIDRITHGNQIDTSYKDHTLFNQTATPIDYGRFIKGTMEGKVFVPLWSTGQMVFRGFVGWSVRMKHTPVLPIQSRFFAGGTNGMRGWRSNLLGPGGSDVAYSNKNLPPGGDFMVEANAEFRFKVWSYVNMALFTDVGNVWMPNNTFAREVYGEKSTLKKENLLPGWDAGTGLRLDFSFLILRLDFAQQLFIPQYKTFFWNIDIENYTSTLNTSIGIGYPF